MILSQTKIKPLSLFTRNHTESHDRGITYHLHGSISEMLMSIFFGIENNAPQATLASSVAYESTEVKP